MTGPVTLVSITVFHLSFLEMASAPMTCVICSNLNAPAIHYCFRLQEQIPGAECDNSACQHPKDAHPQRGLFCISLVLLRFFVHDAVFFYNFFCFPFVPV
jgi:hypothetical protein